MFYLKKKIRTKVCFNKKKMDLFVIIPNNKKKKNPKNIKFIIKGDKKECPKLIPKNTQTSQNYLKVIKFVNVNQTAIHDQRK